MRLYFSYVDSPPDLEEFEILKSSYPSFNWNQTILLKSDVLHEDLDSAMSADDIVVKNVEVNRQ